MIVTRHAKSNFPGMEDYDSSKPNSYIMYWDANNLYSLAMMGSLPVGNFLWERDMPLEEVLNIKETDMRGCFVEVDLSVPEELHDVMNDYPLAPEVKSVKHSMLSPYCKALKAKMGGSISDDKTNKLLTTLEPKKNYVCHYKNLQLYVKLGMKVDCVHRVLSFDQQPWMAPYIAMNTELRKKARNEFEKKLFKDLINAVFGKTMENARTWRASTWLASKSSSTSPCTWVQPFWT